MQLSATTLLKNKHRSAPGLPKVGERVSFSAAVLRVMLGERRPLLLIIEVNGIKLVIDAEHVREGAKLKGDDKTTLAGTVTRVGVSMVEELTPVSIAVDGYKAMRVTLSAKSVRRG